MISGTGPIKRGIVRLARSNGPLKAALVGGIHQSLALREVPYPYLVYTQVSAPIIRDWGTSANQGSREIRALFDLTVYAKDTVDAENVDQLIDNLFDGADRELDPLVDGQRVTYCARIASLPGGGPEKDDSGKPFASVGGTYEIWTEQSIPLPDQQTLGAGAAFGPTVITGP